MLAFALAAVMLLSAPAAVAAPGATPAPAPDDSLDALAGPPSSRFT